MPRVARCLFVSWMWFAGGCFGVRRLLAVCCSLFCGLWFVVCHLALYVRCSWFAVCCWRLVACGLFCFSRVVDSSSLAVRCLSVCFVGGLLFVVCCSLLVCFVFVCWLLMFAVCSVLFIDCGLWLLLFVVWCSMFIVRCLRFVVGCLSFVVCCFVSLLAGWWWFVAVRGGHLWFVCGLVGFLVVCVFGCLAAWRFGRLVV